MHPAWASGRGTLLFALCKRLPIPPPHIETKIKTSWDFICYSFQKNTVFQLFLQMRWTFSRQKVNLILFAGHFRLLGEDKTSNLTYWIIFFGVFCFSLGGLFAKKNKYIRLQNKLIHQGDYASNKKNALLIKLVFGFTLIYTTYTLISLLPLLLGGYSIGAIRQMYLVKGSSSVINSNALDYFVRNVIFQTCQTTWDRKSVV